MEDDKILRLVSSKGNKLYDEERRLFYVACTRAKDDLNIYSGNDDQIAATVVGGYADFGVGDPIFSAVGWYNIVPSADTT